LELLAFPHGRHDDQVDSISQFLKWAATRKFLEGPSLGIGLISIPNDQPSWFGEGCPPSFRHNIW
jgi:hypothetical protein